MKNNRIKGQMRINVEFTACKIQSLKYVIKSVHFDSYFESLAAFSRKSSLVSALR